jgi:hypothetical protein
MRIACIAAYIVATIVVTISAAGVANAEPAECIQKLPAIRSGHWSYRTINGQRCWYRDRVTVQTDGKARPSKAPKASSTSNLSFSAAPPPAFPVTGADRATSPPEVSKTEPKTSPAIQTPSPHAGIKTEPKSWAETPPPLEVVTEQTWPAAQPLPPATTKRRAEFEEAWNDRAANFIPSDNGSIHATVLSWFASRDTQLTAQTSEPQQPISRDTLVKAMLWLGLVFAVIAVALSSKTGWKAGRPRHRQSHQQISQHAAVSTGDSIRMMRAELLDLRESFHDQVKLKTDRKRKL